MQEQEGAKHQPVVGGGEGASDRSRGKEGAAEEVGAGIRTEAKDNGGGLVSTESSGHVQQTRAEDASVKELVGHEGFRDATRVRANACRSLGTHGRRVQQGGDRGRHTQRLHRGEERRRRPTSPTSCWGGG